MNNAARADALILLEWAMLMLDEDSDRQMKMKVTGDRIKCDIISRTTVTRRTNSKPLPEATRHRQNRKRDERHNGT